MSRPSGIRWVNWVVGALAVAGVALTVLFYFIARDAEVQRQEQRFADKVDHQIFAVRGVLAAHRAVLSSLSSYVQAADSLDQDHFGAFAAPLVAETPGIQALEWIPRVAHADREKFEAAASRESREYRIMEQTPERVLGPAAARPEYFPVRLVYPETGNRPALGFDLGSETLRREALLRAMETGQPTATAPITLVQETGSQRAYLVFLPVWNHGGLQPVSPDLRGFVLGVFRTGDVLNNALAGLVDSSLPMTVRDLDAGEAGWIYGNSAELDPDHHVLRKVTLPVNGRRWEIDLVATPERGQGPHLLPMVILCSGLLVTSIFTILLVVLAHGHAAAEALAFRRTAQLQASEERLRTVADLSSDFVFWRHPDGGLAYVSPAAQTLTGYSVQEFLARNDLLDEIIAPQDREVWRQHWEAVLQGEACGSRELRLVTREGRERWARHTCRPIRDPGGQLLGVRASLTDITDAKRYADFLDRERRLFTGGPVAVFRWGAGEGWPVEYASANVKTVFGVEPDDFISGRVTYGEFIHPQDRERVTTALREQIRSEREALELDYRIIDRSGRTRWLLDTTVVVRDAGGKALHLEGYLLDVSEREEAQRKLQESRQQLDLALAGANLGLWDWEVATGRVDFDERWAAMLGYQLEELDPTVDTWSDLVHPDDLPEVVGILQNHLEGKTSQYESEHRLRHKDGSWVWVLDRGRVLCRDENGAPVRAVGTHLDITARRHQEARRSAQVLLREKATRRLARSSSPDEITTAAREFSREFAQHLGGVFACLLRLSDWSDNPRTLFEWTSGPVTAGSFRAANAQQCRFWWKLTGYGNEVRTLDLEDTEFPDGLQSFLQDCGVGSLVLTAVPVGPDHRYILAIGSAGGAAAWSAQDLETFQAVRDAFVHAQQRVAFRQESDQTRGLLVKALDRAEQANKVKTTFLARMSHEIRTPMTAIVGLTDILVRTGANLGQRERTWLTKIRTNADHLVALLNDLLDVSKIDAGELQISPGPVTVAEVLATVEATFQPIARAKKVDLLVACRPEVPARIVTDGLRLRQILLNLVGNAVKFTDQGSVQVDVGCRDRDADPGRDLMVVVRDTGVGIDPAQHEAIFQPFLQAPGVDNSAREGTGLGLDISRRLARALGGDITLVSQPGLGSAFTLALPLAAEVTGQEVAESAVGPVDAGAAPEDRRRVLSGRRVLLVDDNPENRMVVNFYLEDLDMICETAINGADGVARARAAVEQGQPFDLILMDMRMPVMNGYEATAKLRQGGLKTPIIALTAHAMDGDRQACLNFGCSDYLSKPIELEALLAALADQLSPRPVPEPAPSDLPPELENNPRFAALVQKFKVGLLDVREELAAARRAGEQEKIEGLIHRLHGTAASFGLPRISDVAGRCEEALRVGTLLENINELDELETMMIEAGTSQSVPQTTVEPK